MLVESKKQTIGRLHGVQGIILLMWREMLWQKMKLKFIQKLLERTEIMGEFKNGRK